MISVPNWVVLNFSGHRKRTLAAWLFLCLGLVFLPLSAHSQTDASASVGTEDNPYLERGMWTMEFNIIRAFGVSKFGSEDSHNFILGDIRAGYVLTDRICNSTFLKGQFEITGQIWGGYQDYPNSAYLIGFNPGLRYHFDTGRSIKPYLGVSAGVMATDIGRPDLGGDFQFNQQYGAGMHWFFREDWALNMEYRFIHISNAGIRSPNQGVNSNMIVLGLFHTF